MQTNKNIRQLISKSSPSKTKEALICSAKKLFAERGYDGTTVKELCDEAKVNSCSISYHFDGKEGLYKKCISLLGETKLDTAKRFLKKPKNRDEFIFMLKLYVEEVLVNFVNEPELHIIIHRDCDYKNKLTTEIFRQTYLEVHKIFITYIKNGQNLGFVKPEIDPDIIRLLFFGSLISLSKYDHIHKKYYSKSISNSKYRVQLIDNLMLMFTNGIMTNV